MGDLGSPAAGAQGVSAEQGRALDCECVQGPVLPASHSLTLGPAPPGKRRESIEMTSKVSPGLIWPLTMAWAEYLRPSGSLREEDRIYLSFFEPLDPNVGLEGV